MCFLHLSQPPLHRLALSVRETVRPGEWKKELITITSHIPSISRLTLQVHLQLGHRQIDATAFIDSRVAVNIIDLAYLTQLGVNGEALYVCC